MTLFVSVKSVLSLTLVSGFIIGHATSQSPVSENHRWTRLGFVEQTENNCGADEFQCENGGCIHKNLVCDGRVDCADHSDETRAECAKPGRTCPDGAFRCDYGACAPQNASCNGVKDCSDYSDELLAECPKPLRNDLLLVRISGVTRQPKITAKQPTIDPATIQQPESTTPKIFESIQPSTISTTTSRTVEEPTMKTTTTPSDVDSGIFSLRSSVFCLAPPQPANGRWTLLSHRGPNDNVSEIPEGAKMKWNSLLYYTCDPGYLTADYPWPRCLSTGKWSRSPVCTSLSGPPETFCTAPLQPDFGSWIADECFDFIDNNDPGYTSPYCTWYSDEEFEIGRELYFSCESGYSTDKYPLPRCLATGNWTRIPVCTEVDDDPDTVQRFCPIEQTTLEPPPKNNSDSPTDEDLDCLPTGLFCLAPPEPANGHRVIANKCNNIPGCKDCEKYNFCRIPNGTKLVVDEVLYYRCDLGYDTEEYPLPRCLPTGEWSRTPVCTKVEEESPSTDVP